MSVDNKRRFLWEPDQTTPTSDSSGPGSAVLVAALEAHNYDPWYSALLHSALEETRDAAQAVSVADAAFAQHPADPSVPQEDDADVLFAAPDGAALATGDEKWITIGGHAEGDEKHVGGFPVQIAEDGTILKGRLQGKNVKDVKDHYDAQRKEGKSAQKSQSSLDDKSGSGHNAPVETKTQQEKAMSERTKAPASKTITIRSAMRNVDTYRVGGILKRDDGYYVIEDHDARSDNQGGYKHTLDLRPANEAEAKVATVADLKKQIAAMGGGPDDDRNQSEWSARRRVLDNQVRALEGRPSAEAEEQQQTAKHQARFARAWSGTLQDRLDWLPILAVRPGSPIPRERVDVDEIARLAGIPRQRLAELSDLSRDEGDPLPAPATDDELRAIAKAVGVSFEELKHGGPAPEVTL